MKNVFAEMNLVKLKPPNVTIQRKRKNSLEIHLASALQKRFKGNSEDEESEDSWS